MTRIGSLSAGTETKPADQPEVVRTIARRRVARARRWRVRVEPGQIILIVAALAVVYLAVVPVATMVIASLRSTFLAAGPSHWTFAHYVDTFSSDGFGGIVRNSFIYAGSTAIICTVIGFGLAWLVTRTNTPAKAFARAAALIPFIIPGIPTPSRGVCCCRRRPDLRTRCYEIYMYQLSTSTRCRAWCSSSRPTSSRSPF